MRYATTMVLLALTLGSAAPAAAFDLTGTWQGSWSCVGTRAGVKDKEFNKESTAVITSIGNDTFAAILDGDLPYRGIQISDAKKPEKGELAIVHCGATDDLKTSAADFFEAGRFKVSTKGAKGSIAGITIYSDDAGHVPTCKYKYKRVDTTNPNLFYSCS